MKGQTTNHVPTFFPLSSSLHVQALPVRASSLDKISVHEKFGVNYHVPDLSLLKIKEVLYCEGNDLAVERE